jgi:D-beta-D-heptose 7-phosphate kinase/D-beta-D-heptose 1-phosphate adenosyltransferase
MNIGCVNGCWDLLHLGHIRFLKEARDQCDYLIVLLNSDSSVRKIKGPSRPINGEQYRKEMLESIKYVDEVFIFKETTPLKMIKKIRPNKYFKSKVENKSAVAEERKLVESYGGKFVILPTTGKMSSTKILEKMRK